MLPTVTHYINSQWERERDKLTVHGGEATGLLAHTTNCMHVNMGYCMYAEITAWKCVKGVTSSTDQIPCLPPCSCEMCKVNCVLTYHTHTHPLSTWVWLLRAQQNLARQKNTSLLSFLNHNDDEAQGMEW